MTAGQNHLKNNNFPVPKGRIGKYSYLAFMVELVNLLKKNITTLDNLNKTSFILGCENWNK